MKNIKLLMITLLSMVEFVYGGGDIANVSPYETENVSLVREEPIVYLETVTLTEKATPKVIKKQKKILSNGFYVGLGFSGNRYENDVITSTSLGLLGKVGYDFNAHMGLEVNGLQSVANNNGTDITHIGLFLKPMMPIGQLLNVYGLVGVATTRISQSEIEDFSYGIGVQLDLSKDEVKEGKYSRDFNGKGDQETGIGFFIEYKKATPNLDIVGIGLTYAF